MTNETLARTSRDPRRVLVAHNSYRHAGGEDAVVAAEIELLVRRGHEVIELRRDNADIESSGGIGLAVGSLWSRRAHAEIRELIDHHRPDVVHIHNTLPLLSPAVHWAASEAGAAVVQTLHNFRLACPQAMFLREGKVCEACLGRTPLPAIMHACYRGSRAQSSVVTSMLVLHRAIGTWRDKVDRFIALSQFSRGKFIESGLLADRISVKPNFVEECAVKELRRDAFLFVGRLAPEKGIEVLAEASMNTAGVSVRVVGSGPESARLAGLPRIVSVGELSPALVSAEMDKAIALLVPSVCFETFGRVVVEAYSRGLPVIASRIGSLAELVNDGRTGLLFRTGDASDLAQVMDWAQSNRDLMAEMGRNARACYESLYTPEINYGQMMTIYESAIETRRSRYAVRQA